MATLEILRMSASSAPAPGIRLQPTVTKLVDTTTCIGCKACEVACQEWNDLPPETTVQMGTYQTLPDMTENFWNLIRFREHDDEDGKDLPRQHPDLANGDAAMFRAGRGLGFVLHARHE